MKVKCPVCNIFYDTSNLKTHEDTINHIYATKRAERKEERFRFWGFRRGKK